MSATILRPTLFTLWISALGGLACLGFTASVSAQQPFVYPAKGQSSQRMATDKAECQAWATQQTGFDPMLAATSQSAPAQQQQKGGVLRGGARGAAAGAAIGAIAGNAGEGAAIGAASGGVLAGAKRRRQQQAQAQQAQAQSQQVSAFQRAFGA